MQKSMYKEYAQCPICGDPLLINNKDTSKLKCDCCGFSVDVKTEVKEEDHERLKQASDALRSYEFDRAEDRYNLILEDNDPDSEVYLMALFGKLLSSFGVVYIKDFNGETIPTFSEYDPDTPSIKDTDIYKAIVNSKVDARTKKPYIDMIDSLDKVYKRIDKEIDEKPLYNFFICTKISRKTPNNPDADGLTIDSSYASRFYDYLVKSGYKVFYSDKCCNEIEYDSQILSALLKSEKMLVIATQNEYLESPWVQSEWRRWLNFINCGKKSRDSLILCFPTFGMKKFELPRVLRKVQRYTSEIEVLSSLTPKKETKVVEPEKIKIKVEEKPIVKENPKVEEKKEVVKKASATSEELSNRYYDFGMKKYNEKDYASAIDYFVKSLTKKDNSYARKALGDCYYNGYGFAQSYEKAIELYKMVADKEKNNCNFDGEIYYILSECYLYGRGVEKSLIKSDEYYLISLAKGYKKELPLHEKIVVGGAADIQTTSNYTINENYKNRNIALLYCIFFGFLGAHKFYEKKPGLGILYMFTCGLFCIGWIVDIIVLCNKPEYYSVEVEEEKNNLVNIDNLKTNEKPKKILKLFNVGKYIRSMTLKNTYKKFLLIVVITFLVLSNVYLSTKDTVYLSIPFTMTIDLTLGYLIFMFFVKNYNKVNANPESEQEEFIPNISVKKINSRYLGLGLFVTLLIMPTIILLFCSEIWWIALTISVMTILVISLLIIRLRKDALKLCDKQIN